MAKQVCPSVRAFLKVHRSSRSVFGFWHFNGKSSILASECCPLQLGRRSSNKSSGQDLINQQSLAMYIAGT